MDLSQKKKNLIFAGCFLLIMVVQLGNGISNIMSSILTKMDAMQYYSIQAVLFTLTIAVTNPIGGRLGDIIGRKTVSLIGAVIYLMGSALMTFGALLTSFTVFIAGRIINSAGAGLFLSIPFAICADIFPGKAYTKKVGLLTAATALGATCGATLAGILDSGGIGLVAIAYPGAVALAGALLIFTQLPASEAKCHAPVDVAGIALVSIFMACMTLAFSFGGKIGFMKPIILAGFVVSVLSFFLLLKVEKKKQTPFIPFALFRNLKFTGVCFFTAFISVNISVMAAYVPLTGQKVMGLASTVTGLFTLPRSIVCIVLPSIAAIWVNKKEARRRQALILTALCVLIAFTGLYLLGPASPAFLPFVLLAITGVSEAFRGVSTYPMLVSLLDEQDRGIGIALNNTMGTLLAAIAGSILSAIYTPLAQTDIPQALHMVYAIVVLLELLALLIAVFVLKDRKTTSIQ